MDKILIITPDIIGPVKGGGIGSAFFNLAVFLRKEGYSVEILYVLGDYRETKESINYWIDYYRNLDIKFIPLIGEKYEKVKSYVYRDYAYRVYLWLKEHKEKYKIIIFPEWMGSLYYVLLVKRLSLDFQDKIFIANVHSPEIWAYLGNFKLPDFVDLVERDYMERKCIAWADILVSPSQYMLNWLKENKFELPEKHYVISNIFSGVLNKVLKNEFQAKYEEITELIFFSRLEIRKGLKLFIDTLYRLDEEIINKIRKITFLGKALIGDFDSVKYINERLDELKRRYKFEVEIITDKSRDEALKILQDRRGSALVLIPTLIDNLPNVVYECMELKLRFGVSRVGGIPEMIEEGAVEEVTFEPNPSALAEFIKKAIEKGIPLVKPSSFVSNAKHEWLNVINEASKKQPIKSTEKAYPEIKSSLEKPKVTVCIVHYERPHLLEGAIQSVLEQTYENLEVVLVDDGSRSQKAIDMLDNLNRSIFQKRGWKIIKQPNKYLGAARNTGLKNAAGNYIFFLDDDNRLLPNCIERMVEVALKTSADIVTCALYYGEDLESREELKIWNFVGPDLGSGVFRNVFGDANALWKRESILKLGGFSEIYGVGHEDWEIYAKAVIAGLNLVYIPEPLVLYRVDKYGMLRSGNLWLNHARSYMPFYRFNPFGLGTALGYAIFLHLSKHFDSLSLSISKSGPSGIIERFYRKFKILLYKFTEEPHLVKKFCLYLKKRGIKYTLKKTYEYLKNL